MNNDLTGEIVWDLLCSLGMGEIYENLISSNKESRSPYQGGRGMSHTQKDLFIIMWDSPKLTYEEIASRIGCNSKTSTLRQYGRTFFKVLRDITNEPKLNKSNFKIHVNKFLKNNSHSDEAKDLIGIMNRSDNTSIISILTSENKKYIESECKQTGNAVEQIINDALQNRYIPVLNDSKEFEIEVFSVD
jgi:hypothetical protein